MTTDERVAAAARRAAEAIWRDLLDRRGIKWECQNVDDDVRDGDIFPAFAAIIEREMAPLMADASADTARVSTLVELIGAHEGGGDPVKLSYDDATFNHTVSVGKRWWYARGLRGAIDEATKDINQDAVTK